MSKKEVKQYETVIAVSRYGQASLHGCDFCTYDVKTGGNVT